MTFFRREPMLGEIVADNITANPEEWEFGNGFPLPLSNRRTGWTLRLCETWAGDSLDMDNIRLCGREVRKLWRAVETLRSWQDDNARSSALAAAVRSTETRSRLGPQGRQSGPKGNAPHSPREQEG